MSRVRPAFEEAQDVVAGRSRPTVRELFDLIHAINPTTRASDPRRRAQTARDYELKARLQSLLVRSHGDELRVRLEDDGTIAIAHRYSNRDACHAQLDALDDDARAWVRWQLDTSEEAPTASTRGDAPAPEAEDHGDPLERGRQALAEYDFELAVSLFREALVEPGGVEPARALLEVLVDSLAQDAEALAKSRGCLACHAPAAKKIGPSYKDIAAKYQGDAAAPAMLAAKIQKGGSGNWGKVPMPPNPRIDDAAAKTLVTWILATK